MSIQDNKALFRQFVKEVMNQGNLAAVDELMSPEFVEHIPLPPTMPRDREGVKLIFAMYQRTFSDFQATIEDLIAEGDKVVGYLTLRGRHTGAFAGFPPTGRAITFQTIDIFRIADGKIVEHWGIPDQFALHQQLAAHSPADPNGN